MIKNIVAILFSFFILTSTILPTVFMVIDTDQKITMEIDLEEELKEKEPKISEFSFDKHYYAIASDERNKNRNNYIVIHYNSHYLELHSPPPETV